MLLTLEEPLFLRDYSKNGHSHSVSEAPILHTTLIAHAQIMYGAVGKDCNIPTIHKQLGMIAGSTIILVMS